MLQFQCRKMLPQDKQKKFTQRCDSVAEDENIESTGQVSQSVISGISFLVLIQSETKLFR